MVNFSRYFDFINGSYEEFKLEHRIFNLTLFFSILLCFQSTIFNYKIELNQMAVISPFLCGIVLIFNYYLSRVKRYYTLPVISTFALILYIFIPILWISNGGLNGGTIYYIFIFSVIIALVSLRKDVKVTFLLSIFVIVGVLIYLEFTTPSIIQGYQSELDRLYDLTWGIFITIFALICITEVFIVNYTKEKLKNEKYTILIQEQKNQIQQKNEILQSLNSSLNEKIEYTEDLYKHLLEEVALYDELTGLYNRREIMRIITEKIQDFHISSKMFVAAKLDIDQFREINERYGTSLADELLTKIGFMLKEKFSTNVQIGRYGSEEFLLIFDGSDIDKIYSKLENFRLLVKDKKFTSDNIRVTISGYLKLYEGQTYKSYIDSLDKNLHKSKVFGNNLIMK